MVVRRLGGTRNISCTARRFKDPWLLPNTPEHEMATQSPPNLPPLTPIPRPNEPVENLRARLVYQSRKRGTLESDLLLSTFAQEYLGKMTEVELKEYDKVSSAGFPYPTSRPDCYTAVRRTRLGHLLLVD